MKYKNRKTGITIDFKCCVLGGDWELIEAEDGTGSAEKNDTPIESKPKAKTVKKSEQ